jgi:hypothetical protein
MNIHLHSRLSFDEFLIFVAQEGTPENAYNFDSLATTGNNKKKLIRDLLCNRQDFEGGGKDIFHCKM